MCSDLHSRVSTEYRASLHCVLSLSSSDIASNQKLQVFKWKLGIFSLLVLISRYYFTRNLDFNSIVLIGICYLIVNV